MRQRSNGTWELRVYVGRDPLSQKPLYRSRTVHGGKRDAQRAMTVFLSELDGETPTRASARKITVAQLLAAHLDGFEGSPTTVRNYRNAIDLCLLPYIGDMPIGKVEPALLDALYARIAEDRDVGPPTIRRVHAILRGAFARGLKWGWVTSNPARDATPPRVVKPDLRMPTPADVLAAIGEAERQSPAVGMFVRLAAATGARRGELVGLTWDKTDFDNATVTIDVSAYGARGQGVKLKDTKNHSHRRIGLDPDTTARLATHRRDVVAAALASGTSLGSDAFVFSFQPDGTIPWSVDVASRAWARVRDAVGLDGVRLHDLRHFQATMLLQAGIPVANVSKRVGHRDSATTLNVYSKYLEQTDRTAADVVGALLTPAPLPAKSVASRRRAKP